ncbi:MAG: hypothetical protein IJK56_11080 [Firmicutes bacterium]|nr:hypothetical protein [Bacillota bacterium]
MDYLSEIKRNKKLQGLEFIVRTKGDAKSLNKLALEAGRVAVRVLRTSLDEASIDQNSSIEDIRGVVAPVLRANHAYVSELAAASINRMYRSNQIGLKAINPEYDQSREDEIVQKISEMRFTDGSN